MNKLGINNVTLYETKNYIKRDQINYSYKSLNNSITSLPSKFILPSYGNFCIHAVIKILSNEQIIIQETQSININSTTLAYYKPGRNCVSCIFFYLKSMDARCPLKLN